VELSRAKVLGILVLMIPASSARLREWACAGFALGLISALQAHVSIHDRAIAVLPSTATSVLWIGSYCLWRRTSQKPMQFAG
jgi:hypothetical protein